MEHFHRLKGANTGRKAQWTAFPLYVQKRGNQNGQEEGTIGGYDVFRRQFLLKPLCYWTPV